MHPQIAEADWKVLRELKALALERLSERILSTVMATCGRESKTFHDRFLGASSEIHAGAFEMARTFDDLRRSNAINRIALMKAQELISDEEFRRFSEATRESVERILREITVRGKFVSSRVFF